MPTLDWIGKRAVVNHHRELPYRLLHCDSALGAGDADAGNLLVEGDNLHALKALLPYYAGRVKCIYIDPPYNTGNEGWVYNDNVNAPEIKKWLHQTVGKETEDLSRHDKWLCMMYPRLALLREFLAKDGVILVSIDDFEASRLRLLMDEIFGIQNFIAQLVWDKTRKNDAKFFSVGHEYLVVYGRSVSSLRELGTTWREQKPGTREIVTEWRRLVGQYGDDLDAIQNGLRDWYKKLPKEHPSRTLSRYKWVDEFGPWRDRDISWPGGGGGRYDVLHPKTHLPCKVPEAGWRFSKPEEMARQIRVGLVEFRADHTKPPFRKAHLLPVSAELEEDEEDIVDDLDEDDAGMSVMPSLLHKQAQVAVKLLRKIFGGKKVFENPKDHEVIMRLIRYVTKPGDLVLDSFAGSGTTGHAILAMNKEDRGNRRFILCELDSNIARNITAERLRRVINGYGDTPGLGGGFRFCTLGEPMLDAEGHLHPDVTWRDLAHHLWFAETGEPWHAGRAAGTDGQSLATGGPLLGVTADGRAIYLLHDGKDGSTNVLTLETLAGLAPHSGPRIVYGEACTLRPNALARERVNFKQIPYQIRQQ